MYKILGVKFSINYSPPNTEVTVDVCGTTVKVDVKRALDLGTRFTTEANGRGLVMKENLFSPCKKASDVRYNCSSSQAPAESCITLGKLQHSMLK